MLVAKTLIRASLSPIAISRLLSPVRLAIRKAKSLASFKHPPYHMRVPYLISSEPARDGTMYSRELINTLERSRKSTTTKRMSKKKARKNPKNHPVEAFKSVDAPKAVALGSMQQVAPITRTQEQVFAAYEKEFNLALSGSPGCGKTYLALALALKEVIASNFKKRIIIIRSVVPTRDMGFLPGSQEDKEAAYITPYSDAVNELFRDSMAWKKLTERGAIEFMTTSFIRGITLRRAIVIADEFQNCNEHELDSIITRLGNHSRIIFTGDYYQSDFERDRDRVGILNFLKIIDRMKSFKHIEFTWEDCVRSPLVKEYLMIKEELSKSK